MLWLEEKIDNAMTKRKEYRQCCDQTKKRQKMLWPIEKDRQRYD
jgi:hypothetical protein